MSDERYGDAAMRISRRIVAERKANPEPILTRSGFSHAVQTGPKPKTRPGFRLNVTETELIPCEPHFLERFGEKRSVCRHCHAVFEYGKRIV